MSSPFLQYNNLTEMSTQILTAARPFFFLWMFFANYALQVQRTDNLTLNAHDKSEESSLTLELIQLHVYQQTHAISVRSLLNLKLIFIKRNRFYLVRWHVVPLVVSEKWLLLSSSRQLENPYHSRTQLKDIFHVSVQYCLYVEPNTFCNTIFV